MVERSRKLRTPVRAYGKTCFLFKTVPAIFPLTWWRRMALSTVSFVVDTRIDHRFAIQTELNDGPYSLSALRFIPPLLSSLCSLHPTSVVIFSPRSLYPFRSRVHLSVILFFREKKGKRRVVSTVCKSTDQSIESGKERKDSRDLTISFHKPSRARHRSF